jgi:SlyX protein
MHEDRLTELEIRVEYQDRLINTLNEVLTSQQAELDRLAAKMDKLQGKLDNEQFSIGPAGERPPHY